MPKFIDLTEQKFNKLTVIERMENDENGNAKWLCNCDCGKSTIVRGRDLKNNHTKSCGCLNRGNKFDLSSKSFITIYDKKGNKCLIDSEDLEKVKQHTWHLNGSGYFATSLNDKNIILHRFLLNFEGEEIDHINNIKVDNRKQNLRICTHKENTFNRMKQQGTSSKYKGVSWKNRSKKWCCRITFNRKTLHLGYFTSEEEAGKRYDEEAIKLFGEFAKLNFPVLENKKGRVSNV